MVALNLLALIKATSTVLNTLTSVYVWLQHRNANREIEEAEKMLAAYHKARIQGKAGSASDKTSLAYKTSKAFNAYLVGVTTFNTTEAAARAHDLQATNRKKNVVKALTIQAAFNIVLTIAIGQSWRIPFIIAAMVGGTLFNFNLGESTTHIINFFASHSLTRCVYELVYMVFSYKGWVPKSFIWLASIGYCGLSIMSTLSIVQKVFI